MKKQLVCVVTCAVLAAVLAGCGSEAEEPSVPTRQEAQQGPNAPSPLTSKDKLTQMALGEKAVWSEYEVSVTSVDRADGKLTAYVDIAGRGKACTITPSCLLSFGMPPMETSFGDELSLPVDEKTSLTFTFDDPYESTRLFWNDGAIEATWLLDAATDAPAPAEAPKADTASEQQKAEVATIETKIATIIADDTYYAFENLDPATATVEPIEGGGYTYHNAIALLDANGAPMTAQLSSTWDADLMCTSFAVDDVVIV